ncbi:MAG: flagellin N-terminal helical domain-containing protein [Desulfocucumaceae bacterium]
MRINHNIAALNTYRQLSSNNVIGAKSLEKLSSGFRINRAADDAAGLAISEKMRGQIRGLDQAVRNSQDGISLIQTAEGALNETHSILQRMRELAVQSANDTNTSADRVQIQQEIDQLTAEINRIGDTTEFNTKKLIDGAMGSAVATAKAAVMTGVMAFKIIGTASAAAAATTLGSLADDNGNGFGITTSDTITITGKLGATYVSATVTVAAGTTLGSLLDTVNTSFTASSTVNASGSITVTGAVGITNDIGGITFSVQDTSGNIRAAATDALSGLAKSQSASNVRADGTNALLIGANQGQSLTLNIDDMRGTALGINGLKVETKSQANVSLKILDAAMEKVSSQRSGLGALQNRLEHTIANLGVSSENLTAAESQIRDVDMAKEMMQFTKNNILSQAATAMLAQANQMPQTVLSLLR